MKCKILLATLLAVASAATVNAQGNRADHSHAIPAQTTTSQVARPMVGPHGGALKQAGDVQVETVVSQGGIQIFPYDRNGKPITVDRARGTVSLRIEGKAKRYRYGLLPDGKGGLAAAMNLAPIASRQIEIDIQLVGMEAFVGKALSLHEVATVPASELQLAAAAIARQKICPVSGKPLGSMGDSIAVNVNGQRVFVCCGGCVDAVESNPAKYAAGRPQITVATATAADADAIARQKVCPVMDEPLGSMGDPIKVTVADKPIFLCCKGCIKKIKADPAKYIAVVYGQRSQGEMDTRSAGASVPAGTEQVRAGVFKIGAEDAPFIAAQEMCPVMDEPLDAMGGPHKVHAAGKAIYICCPGCAKKIVADPQKWLARLSQQGVNAPTLRQEG